MKIYQVAVIILGVLLFSSDAIGGRNILIELNE